MEKFNPGKVSSPSCFSPLSSKRKSQPSKHTSPTYPIPPDLLPMVITEECQHMWSSSYFYWVTDNLSVSLPCGKIELFCLQKVVDNVVYHDSVAFQCQLHSSSDVMLETLTHTGYTITWSPHQCGSSHHMIITWYRINMGTPITWSSHDTLFFVCKH